VNWYNEEKAAGDLPTWPSTTRYDGTPFAEVWVPPPPARRLASTPR
jgi:hypothetical protein